ncbi:MAG: DEAD/DEAH box helicase, partial [Clostridia bacterium]|nr:DEAD/DEAH box helicase [Clostridia bacterium]
MAISQTSIKRLEKQAKQIKDLQTTFASFSDDELKQAFNKLRQDYQDKKITKEQLLEPVYAIVCETAKRVLQKDPYVVQVMGAICLNSGDVAAMATGEGKTLASTMPAVLNALTYKSVHIATANEYLAKRDFDEMRRVYNFLGLNVGVVYSGQSIQEKQQAYACDITYGTGSEFGFDY